MIGDILRIIPRKSGTYTLRIESEPPIIWKTGIPSRDEARARAELLARLCGYRVKEER